MAAKSACWTLKVRFGEEVRRSRCSEETPTAEGVRTAVAQLFALAPERIHCLHFEYFDDEGDACTLNDATFSDFVFLSTESRLLRLYVYEIASPTNTTPNRTEFHSASWSPVAAGQVGNFPLRVSGDTPVQVEDSVASTRIEGVAEAEASMPSARADAEARPPCPVAGPEFHPTLNALQERVRRIRDELQAGVGQLRTDVAVELEELRSKAECAQTELRAHVENVRTGVSSGLERLHANANSHATTLKRDLQDGSQRFHEHLSKSAEEFADADVGPAIGKVAALAAGTLAAGKIARNPVGLAAVAGTAALAGAALAIYTAASSTGTQRESSDDPMQYSSYVSAYMDDVGSTGATSHDEIVGQEDSSGDGSSQTTGARSGE